MHYSVVHISLQAVVLNSHCRPEGARGRRDFTQPLMDEYAVPSTPSMQILICFPERMMRRCAILESLGLSDISFRLRDFFSIVFPSLIQPDILRLQSAR